MPPGSSGTPDVALAWAVTSSSRCSPAGLAGRRGHAGLRHARRRNGLSRCVPQAVGDPGELERTSADAERDRLGSQRGVQPPAERDPRPGVRRRDARLGRVTGKARDQGEVTHLPERAVCRPNTQLGG